MKEKEKKLYDFRETEDQEIAIVPMNVLKLLAENMQKLLQIAPHSQIVTELVENIYRTETEKDLAQVLKDWVDVRSMIRIVLSDNVKKFEVDPETLQS